MSEKIKKNQYVMIKSIENTSASYGLDSGEIMKSMVGEVHKVGGIETDGRLYISKTERSFKYSWDKRDVEPVKGKEVEPIIFKFDEKQLVI